MSELLEELNKIIAEKQPAIDSWFAKKRLEFPAFFYNSVDIRYSGQKIVPVDTNIFPAGFNNLSEKAKDIAAEEMKNFLKKYHANIAKILLITELHTRNKSYLENVVTIKELLIKAGYQVEFGIFSEGEDIETEYKDGTITLNSLIKQGDKIILKNGFTPDLIITNNDFTSGSPEILHNIDQPVIPPISMGWYKRKKYNNCIAYNKIATEFAEEFDINPFLITTEVASVSEINFKEKQGLEILTEAAETILADLANKYKKFKITQDPYLFIKANRGTYGMGIMVIRDASEIMTINKKIRNKMNVIKHSTINDELLLQEGIATINDYQGNSAEPFIYQVGGRTAGIILRVNSTKDNYANLNSSGMEFVAADDLPYYQKYFKVFTLIASLASLASSYEQTLELNAA